MPSIIITDQDHAISGALQETQGWKDIPHRLCSWHIGRNLRRYFKFIKSEHQDIKEKIFSLPTSKHKETFDENEKAAVKFLKDLDLKKSLDYLENLLKIKEKWARPYHLPYFDADITTTSRAESWNRHVKRFVGSRSEISHLVDFISNVDKTNITWKTDFTTDVLRFAETDPLVMDLKSYLSPRLYEKQLGQYFKARKCENKPVLDNKDEQTYEVIYINKQIQSNANINPKIHRVSIKDKIQCSCSYYRRVGLICLHIFHICGIRNIKTISQLPIANRWRRILDSDDDSFHFRFMDDPIVEEKKEEDLGMIVNTLPGENHPL